MGSGIYVALAGAIAQEHALDVVAENVANANTTAYRAERVSFGEVLTRAKGKDKGFVAVAKMKTDDSPGPNTTTGNPLDIRLEGDGFFAVDTPHGVRWSRAGDLRLDPTGHLVDGLGHAVRSTEGKPITLPTDTDEATVIDRGGIITVGDSQIGQLDLQRFAPEALKREGAGLWIASQKPIAAEPPKVIAGALEGANYNVVRGMVDLVRTTRSYEALHQMIESYRELDDRSARGSGQG